MKLLLDLPKALLSAEGIQIVVGVTAIVQIWELFHISHDMRNNGLPVACFKKPVMKFLFGPVRDSE